MTDQRRSNGVPRRTTSLTRQPLRGAGFDELSRALEVARGDQDLARPAAPGRVPRAGAEVGPLLGALDPLGPQETADRRSLHSVADDGESNPEHRGNGTNEAPSHS